MLIYYSKLCLKCFKCFKASCGNMSMMSLKTAPHAKVVSFACSNSIEKGCDVMRSKNSIVLKVNKEAKPKLLR